MRRGLDGFFASSRGLMRFSSSTGAVSTLFGGEIARGKHLFPFRTEPLSLSAPMVLGGQPPGRVGRRRSFIRPPERAAFLFASLLRRQPPAEGVLLEDRVEDGTPPESLSDLARALHPGPRCVDRRAVSTAPLRGRLGWHSSTRKGHE